VIPDVEADIAALEVYVQQHPDAFMRDIHNQLRHFYASRDHQRSMYHVDMILAHSIMDAYMLDILSEWQLEQDTALGRVHMFDVMERLPSFMHIRVACLIKTGDVSAAHHDVRIAMQLYQRAVALGNRHGAAHSALKRYQTLAQYRLRTVQE
jgi:hypothetical protein